MLPNVDQGDIIVNAHKLGGHYQNSLILLKHLRATCYLDKEDGPTVIVFNVPFYVGSAWVVPVTMQIGFRFPYGAEHPEHRVRPPSECVSI